MSDEAIESALERVLNPVEETPINESDQSLIDRAIKTGNHRLASRDLILLSVASIWVVITSLLVKFVKNVNSVKREDINSGKG